MEMGEDVVFDILLWLPVTVLLRFKAVCKSWRSLIESSAFISQHLHHHHHHLLDDDSWNLIILEPNQNWIHNLEFSILSGNNFQFSHNLDLQTEFDLSEFVFRAPTIIASCHGIICIDLGYDTTQSFIDTEYYDDLSLWNPATRELVILPQPPVPIPMGLFMRFNYGFGFDVQTNDYKVVRIIIYEHNAILDSASSVVNSRTDVYSLTTNSWTNVDNTVLPVNFISSNPKLPFPNRGIYCWMGSLQYMVNGVETVTRLIFSFDFTTQVFGTTVQVPDVYNNAESSLELSYLREKIACIVLPKFDSTDCLIHIWVLDQYGVNDSWTNLYSVRTTIVQGSYPSGISKNGKLFWANFFCIEPDRPTLYLSDLATHELNILPVQQPSHNLQIAVYKESLVSIKSAIGASPTKSVISS